MQKNRNGTADLLKGVAVLLMIQVHIMEQFATSGLYQSSIGKISLFLGGPACAPVFMAVMGYFVASSEKPMRSFIIRGLILFMGGIILNITRSANLLMRIFLEESDLNPWNFIFGADILTLAGLSVLLIGLLRPLLKSNYLLYLILAMLMVVFSQLLSNHFSFKGNEAYVLAFVWGNYEWSYFPLFPWMAYVLLGYALRLFVNLTSWAKQANLMKFTYILIPFLLFSIFTLPWASSITSNLKGESGYYHHGILFFMWTAIFMISYVPAMMLVEKNIPEQSLSRIIKWMGKRVTVLYVIQWLIIGNVATWLYQSQNLLQAAAWFLAVSLVSCGLAWIFQWIIASVNIKS